MKQSIAIIGGGVAGLTAAYLLHETYDITLYEKDSRLGGNAYTYRSPDGDDIDISVFAFMKQSYTNFFKLLGELGVETMRFSLRGIGATSYNLDTHEGYAFSPLSLRGFLPAHFRRARSMAVSIGKGVELLDAGQLDGLSMEESLRRLLGPWKYKDGLVVVHRDDAHFPPEPMRNLYCYLYTDRDGKIETSINACYCKQKGVSKTSRFLGTQHPNFPIREELTDFQKVFRTPIFDPDSVSTIAELPTLNGQRHTYYCGSHFGVGLHEDAVTSALNIAKDLGVDWS